MKFIKQNIFPMIAVAVFAILAAIVENAFVYDYDVEFKQAVELTKASFDTNQASGSHDVSCNGGPDKPIFLSRESTSESFLLTRRPGRPSLSRTLRNGCFQGFCGRDAQGFKRFTIFAGNLAASRKLSNNVFPTPLAYSTSKEYYVFTLKRILC